MSGSSPNTAPTAWILTSPEGSSLEIWGMTPVERLRRCLERAGVEAVRTLVSDAHTRDSLHATPPGSQALVARADWIYDERLIAALVGAPDTLLVGPGGEPVAASAAPERVAEVAAALRAGRHPAGLQRRAPQALAPAYTAQLRKSEPPFLFPAQASLLPEIEERTFAASYKGATDLVTKWVWPRPALAVVRRLAAAQVHPNTVTVASWLLALATFWLFAEGAFLVGLVVAWSMTFLDTVDGKLARVTLTSSRVGHVLDHGLDLVHPPFWWLAWGVGIGAATGAATLIVIAGYFLGRLLEGLFLLAFGMETHCWRPIDTLFRTITARRNPNLLLLSVGAVAGRADLGMTLVALWTVVSLLFHSVRLAQAGLARRRGETIEPWDAALRGAVRPLEEPSGARP